MITIITKKQLAIYISLVVLFFMCIMYGGKYVNMSLDKVRNANQFVETSTNEKILRWGLKRNGKGNLPTPNVGSEEILNKFNGKYLGDTNKKRIYLTFDEGYENGLTNQILDVLKKNKVNAVFFITMPYLNEQQLLITRMLEEGHFVGNHTSTHPSMPTISKEQIKIELDTLNTKFKQIFNVDMKFMRPPKGEYNENVLSVAKEMGYTTLFWSFAYDDWNTNKIRGVDFVIKKVCDNMHNGAVILLHAVSKDNADALDSVINTLKNEGYEFGNPSELLVKDVANEKQ